MSTTPTPDETKAPGDDPGPGESSSGDSGSAGPKHESVGRGGSTQRRSWILPVVTAALVLGVIATFVALRVTNDGIDADRGTLDRQTSRFATDRSALESSTSELAAERHELSLLVADLQRTQGQLDTRTSDRDALVARSEQTRVELYNLGTALNSQAARLYVQGKLLGDLQSCLRSADQALNALSLGNVDLGRTILESAKESCQVVNDYLAQAGLTT